MIAEFFFLFLLFIDNEVISNVVEPSWTRPHQNGWIPTGCGCHSWTFIFGDFFEIWAVSAREERTLHRIRWKFFLGYECILEKCSATGSSSGGNNLSDLCVIRELGNHQCWLCIKCLSTCLLIIYISPAAEVRCGICLANNTSYPIFLYSIHHFPFDWFQSVDGVCSGQWMVQVFNCPSEYRYLAALLPFWPRKLFEVWDWDKWYVWFLQRHGMIQINMSYKDIFFSM